jgi:hypothetical protein
MEVLKTVVQYKMNNWPYYVGVGICGVLITVVLVTYASLIEKDSFQNTKLLSVLGTFSIASAVAAYALALYYFNSNPNYMIQFVLAVVMLVCLPASLFAISVSTVTISNLRDTLAAGR